MRAAALRTSEDWIPPSLRYWRRRGATVAVDRLDTADAAGEVYVALILNLLLRLLLVSWPMVTSAGARRAKRCTAGPSARAAI